MKRSRLAWLWAGAALVFVAFLLPPFRGDFTRDKRYTLASTTRKIVGRFDKPVSIRVYLKGDFPAYFKKLQYETAGLLEELHRINPRIQYTFMNPASVDTLEKYLERRGMTPAQISVQKKGKLSQIKIYPWAEIVYEGRSVEVPLLTRAAGIPVEEQINRSIENAEYAFVHALKKVSARQKPAIAVLKGNGEWDDSRIADFLMSLRDFYRLAPFTLDSMETSPARTLEQLRRYDMILVAGPTRKFTRLDKLALDQFIMNGGSMMLLFDPVKANKDTLFYRYKTYALNAELELEDLLVFYGLRPKPVLVKDLVAAPVAVQVGEVNGNPQIMEFPWVYSPLVTPYSGHPVGKNIGRIKLDFVSVLDTIPNRIKKTVLLQSSPYTDLTGVPAEINFEDIARKPDKSRFNKGPQILGVLAEGRFRSAFEGRVKPPGIDFKPAGESKIFVAVDADIIKNEFRNGIPLPLGTDKWTGIQYDNKNFLLNVVHYLTDKEGLLSLKNKTIQLSLLDKNKAVAESGFWQWFNLIVPLALLLLIFGAAALWRRKKYTHHGL